MTCAQLQLNLRTAVYHVPSYVTTYYQQQTVVVGTSGRINPPHRPGLETLIFGGTATELEHKYGNSPTETDDEQEEDNFNALEFATTSVRTMGKQEKFSALSIDLSTGKQGSVLPQRRRADSFQGSPSHSPRPYFVDLDTPTATAEEAPSLPPMDNTHSELSNRSVTREDTLPARSNRVALGFDSKHNWALAKMTRCSNPAVPSPTAQDQSYDLSQGGIPLDDMSGLPSPSNLQPSLLVDPSRIASDSNLQVEIQVECEYDAPEISPMPQPSELEHSNANHSVSQDGGIMTTRIGVWR